MNSLASFPEGQSRTVAETGPNNDQIVGTVRGWPCPLQTVNKYCRR